MTAATAKDFLNQQHLVDRILILTECQHDAELAKESMYVLMNALTTCSIGVLLDFWEERNEDLAQKLFVFLRSYHAQTRFKNDPRLLNMLLTTFETILDAQKEHGIAGEGSFGFYFYEFRCFEDLEQLMLDPPEQVFELISRI